MNSIFNGDLSTAKGRTLAWVDALFVDHAVFRLVWSNFAAVAPGRLYRCNHPTPARLAFLTRRYGLRTLINLRGVYGKSQMIRFDADWRPQRALAGGCILLDQGIHMVDMLRLFAGMNHAMDAVCAEYDDEQLATIQGFLARAARAGHESAERLVP